MSRPRLSHSDHFPQTVSSARGDLSTTTTHGTAACRNGAQLAVSTEHNVFVAIGWNFIGYFIVVSDGGREYVSTCSTLCNGKTRDALCTDVGCCWRMGSSCGAEK